MKTLRSLVALALSVLTLLGSVVCVNASEPSTVHLNLTYINPLYEDILTEEDLQAAPAVRSNIFLYAKQEYLTDVQQAGNIIRNAMRAREVSYTLYFQNSADSVEAATADIQNKITQISDIALSHTGVPTEGDYLMWQFGGWQILDATGSYDGTTYYWKIPFTFTYYTTPEEEQQVDAAVQNLLTQLNVADRSDYAKIQAVYDYLCENITYDNEHLGDSSYRHQFTAYGALINGSSVCQGYAVLFYRLALELGIDNRLIPGRAYDPVAGENHGWNIVELGDLYYNADATWDAGMIEYSCFLKGANFADHYRDAEYDTAEFHAEYPMAASDYVPDPADTCVHSYASTVTTEVTCTTPGVITYTCGSCGNSYTEAIPATGHSFGDWTLTTAPTCSDAGVETRSCSCGASETNAIEATGHRWDAGVVQQEPTDMQDGICLYTCEICSSTKTETIAAKPSVSRVFGESRYKTALKAADVLKEMLGISKFETIVVACGTDFADALSGTYLANKKNAPILLVHNHSVSYVSEYILNNLAENGTVYILGGEGAVPVSLDALLAENGITPKRLAGQSRYDTNLLILQEAGVDKEDILICTGKNFADSLSASAVGRPILLTNNIALKDSQKEFLNSLEGNQLYIIGGAGAVSDEIAAEVAAFGSYTRISGGGRYETSIKVAETFFADPASAVLVYGANFPDGLCGGTLAYTLGAPLILARDATASYAINFAMAQGITSGMILGGDALISNNSIRAIFRMTEADEILIK